MEVIIAEKKTKAENSDRISNLPDSTLIGILSLLPDAKNVAQTCILSKRWRKLWTYVSSLSFNFGNFKGKEKLFNRFVSSFLRLRDKASKVDKFELYYSSPSGFRFSKFAMRWIKYAFKHEVKNLVVQLGGCPQALPNESQFHCNTLEEMHLVGIFVADNVCLPKLRKLSLVNVIMCNDSMQKLLFGCPALVTLSMHHSEMRMKSHNFGTIKGLTMESCAFKSLDSPLFTVCAPCVEYLEFVGGRGDRVTFSDMSRVNKAVIISEAERTDYNFDLLSGISSVQALKYLTSMYLKELLDRELQNCRIFNNLKHLEISFCCQRWDFSTLSLFLKHCPNLENLCLLHEEFLCEEDRIRKRT